MKVINPCLAYACLSHTSETVLRSRELIYLPLGGTIRKVYTPVGLWLIIESYFSGTALSEFTFAQRIKLFLITDALYLVEKVLPSVMTCIIAENTLKLQPRFPPKSRSTIENGST